MNMMLLLLTILLVPCIFADETYIVNGNDAAWGRWPWQGSLRLSASRSHYCGCAIISANYGLTAAHCITGGATDQYAVFGTTNVNTNSGTEVQFSAITMHPDYIFGCTPGNCYPHDVAVLHFASPVNPSDVIQYISMTSGGDYDASACWITGWGNLYGNAPTLPDDLQETDVRVPTDVECSTRSGVWYNGDHQVCTYDDIPPQGGACNGDSGGPLQCPGYDGAWRLVGLASWVAVGSDGVPCDTTSPSAYADVQNYRSWICTIVDVC